MSYAIGVDVGGTKIEVCLVDAGTGAVLVSARQPTMPERGGAAVLDDCVSAVDQIITSNDLRADSTPIGIGICELVDNMGQISSRVTLEWHRQTVEAAFVDHRTVVIESDVRAAAIAEHRHGAARDQSPFVYVSVGTGVSFALVVGGLAYRGNHGNAVMLGAPPVERTASGRGLAEQFGVHSAAEVFDCDTATAVIRRGSTDLGQALAWLVNALDPVMIVIGGGLGLRTSYRTAAVDEMRPLVESAVSRSIAVVPAALGAQSGAIGAALLAADEATTHRVPTGRD